MIQRLSSLALRNLRARKARSLLTTAGIVLGVAVVIAVAITNYSTVAAFKQMIDSISGKSDLWVNTTNDKGMPGSFLERTRSARGVELASPGVMSGTGIVSGSKRIPLQLAGVDPQLDRELRTYKISDGRFLGTGASRQIILVRELAEAHDFSVGDKIGLSGAGKIVEFRLVGLIEQQGAGRFAGGDVAFTTLQAAQELFAMKSRLSFIDVTAEDGVDISRLRGRLEDRLGDLATVERPAKRAEAVTKTLRSLRIGLSFFGAIALFVGAFLIYNTLSMVVIERTQELGMLRSLGASTRQITRLVIVEALAIGAIGSVAGVLLGAILARFLLSLMSQMLETKIDVFQVPLGAVVVSVVLGLGATLVGALQPAIAAGRISPLAAIRARGGRPGTKLARVRVPVAMSLLLIGLYLGLTQQSSEAAGIGVFQAGAFMLMLGSSLLLPSLVRPATMILRWPLAVFGRMEARLAAANLTAAKGRTAGTTGAVMISLAMLISIGGMTDSFKVSINDWVDRSIGADVFVSAEPTTLSIKKDFTRKLGDIEGVQVVSPVRFVSARAGKRPVTVRAIDPATFRTMAEMQFTAGKPGPAWRAFTDHDEVFVASGFARAAKLKVGRRLTISTAKGRHPFKIAGIVLDFAGDSGDVVITNRRVMNRYFELDDANLFRIKVRNGYQPGDVARTIEKKYAKPMSLQVRDLQEFRREVDSEVDTSFASFNVIIMLAVVVAGIGVVNTLTMNILERTREIGVLRAIGTTRGQVRRIVLAESAMTGALGAATGIALGVYMAKVIVSAMQELTGFVVSFAFPWQTLWLSLAIVVVFAIAAAVYPARLAARVNIVKAVQYE